MTQLTETSSSSMFIEGLPVAASIGVFDWERQVKQTLLFDLECEYDMSSAMASDSIDDAISYVDVAALITTKTQERHYALLEHLAQELKESLFSTFPMTHLRLRISKPGAVPEARNVGIRICCERG